MSENGHGNWNFEWPTWLLMLAVYGGFALTTYFYHALPLWLALALGAWFVCWHSQLQHEALHGHPTPHAALNGALVLPSLWLWLPYPIYAESHLAHHATPSLTGPAEDPESFYVSAADWARAGPLRRALLWSQQTLAGRLVLGPWVQALTFWRSEIRRLIGGDRSHVAAWLLHLLALVPLFYWLLVVCRIPLLDYVVIFAWPGTALALLRSFAEHRPVAAAGERTAIVEYGGPLALLFLYNNLHALHHERPGVAWYALPRHYRRERARLLAQNGGFVFRHYGEVVMRYMFRPKDSPAHPLDIVADTAAH